MPKITDKLRRPTATPPDPDHDISPQPQVDPGPINQDKRQKASVHEDTVVHARDAASGRRGRRDDASPPDVGAPLRDGDTEAKPKKGQLEVYFRGQYWGPIACGLHRSPEVFEHSTDELPEAAEGFQPGCEQCQEELATSLEFAQRAAPLPVTV